MVGHTRQDILIPVSNTFTVAAADYKRTAHSPASFPIIKAEGSVGEIAAGGLQTDLPGFRRIPPFIRVSPVA